MSILPHKLPKQVTTLEQALEILQEDSWGRDTSWGVIDVERGVIIRKSYHEGCSGADDWGRDEMPIDKSVIAALKSHGYVKGTPHWGYIDEKQLRINEWGAKAAHEIWQRKEEERRKAEGKDA